MMETSFLSQNLSAVQATWCASVRKTCPHSYLSTLHTPTHAHTCNLVDFSSLRGVPCLLKRSDDATASCWAQMLPSVEVGTWIQMCTRTWLCVHVGSSWRHFWEWKTKKQASYKSPFHHLNTGLRNQMIKAASDIVSSPAVIIWTGADSQPGLCLSPAVKCSAVFISILSILFGCD